MNNAVILVKYFKTFSIGHDPQQRYENTHGVAFMRFDETNRKRKMFYQQIDHSLLPASLILYGLHNNPNNKSYITSQFSIKFSGPTTFPGQGMLTVPKIIVITYQVAR